MRFRVTITSALSHQHGVNSAEELGYVHRELSSKPHTSRLSLTKTTRQVLIFSNVLHVLACIPPQAPPMA